MTNNNDTLNNTLQKVLTERFGFNTFRPGQAAAITALLEHKSLLCIQPTGYGKSLLYQLPAVLLDGLTVVISPLLALMRDQIQQLHTRFNITAASINSDQTQEENDRARRSASAHAIKILFVAPEQLDRIDRFNFLVQLPVSLVVVDEAHCISTWGHDFRPGYRQIIHFIHALRTAQPEVCVLGLTATANDKTATDIKEQLSDNEHPVQVQRESMDRPNIRLSVIRADGLAHKLYWLAKLITEIEGCGLIYCATRENTVLVADYLQQQRITGAAYHAGFPASTKQRIQQDFLKNTYKVISATNALGMGIDKPDLRFVIHFDIPSSITAYYQEVGRAGRDGLPARGILLFDPSDKKIQDYFIDSAQPSPTDFAMLLQAVEQAKTAPGLIEMKRLSGLHPTRATVVVAELIEQGYLVKSFVNGRQVYNRTPKSAPPDLTRYRVQYEVRQQELAAILRYAEPNKMCLMQRLRQALGDPTNARCCHCDACANQFTPVLPHPAEIKSIDQWLQQRLVVIDVMKTYKTEPGVSVLDSKLRSPLFIHFMKQRTAPLVNAEWPLDMELLPLIKKYLLRLAQQYRFSSLVVIPSRTWTARAVLANWIAKQLSIPLLLDYLCWRELPPARQGELLNNDQRRYNVDRHMTFAKGRHLPVGAVLVLDDYTGSGSTLSEAARVLRKEAGFNGHLVPFTVAQIKWRLGKAGMI